MKISDLNENDPIEERYEILKAEYVAAEGKSDLLSSLGCATMILALGVAISLVLYVLSIL